MYLSPFQKRLLLDATFADPPFPPVVLQLVLLRADYPSSDTEGVPIPLPSFRYLIWFSPAHLYTANMFRISVRFF